MAARSNTAAVNRFLKAATWLTDEDEPAVTLLKMLARQLDDEPFQAATASQYGLTYRALLKRAPSDESGSDPLGELLDGGA